jgi:hypothetical protein
MTLRQIVGDAILAVAVFCAGILTLVYVFTL